MKNFSFLVLVFLGCLEHLSQVNGQDSVAYTLAQDSQITLAAGSTLGFSKEAKAPFAFSAGLTRSVTVPANSMVAFNRIFINLQHAFDQRTGNFTAPVEGVYEFNVHAQAQSNHRAWLDLYRNTQFLVTLRTNIPYPYNNPNQMHGTAGNSVIIQLQVGDSVYLKARYSYLYDSSVMYGAHDQVYCTFSGYLIAPTYTGLSVVG